MWITDVTIDGDAIPLDEVLASVVIRHGRGAANDPPTASTIQLTLLGVDRVYTAPFRVGVPVSVRADGDLRFTGTVTDAALDDETLTVIGVGPLASLFRYSIGAAPWPSEKWSERVARVFTEAGVPGLLTLLADPGFDPPLVARETEEAVTLDAYLAQLAVDVGAAVADTPDGRVLVQQLTARSMEGGVTWESLPDSFRWLDVDPDCSWAEAISQEALGLPSQNPELILSPDDVEYVPVWVQALELENESTIGYGVDASVTLTDDVSADRYGPYPGGLSTQLESESDATVRAEQRLSRMAYPRWALPAAPVLGGFPLAIGQRVTISGFPPASPHSAVTGVLEGWTDTIDGEEWTIELALSDPVYSGLGLSWGDVPDGLAWNEVNPACSWIDAQSLDALIPTLTEVFDHA